MNMWTEVSKAFVLEEIGITPLLFLVFSLLAFAVCTLLARSARSPSVRSHPGISFFRSVTSRAAEAGGRVHLALGKGSLGTASTAETTIGLSVLEYLSIRAIVYDTQLLVHVPDATTLAAAQGVVQHSRERTGHDKSRGDIQLQFVSPEPLAFALGVASSLEPRGAYLSNSLGIFGPEYLFIGETNAYKAIPQVAGSSTIETLPLMYVVADEALIGEDMFSIGAYLHRPLHLGSLVAQDVLRLILVSSIAFGVLWRSLGLGG